MNTKQIKTILVEKLFGLYDYTLTIPSTAKDNVFILYGDNGTGKSTILRLAYHLLSSEAGRAHKTYLANITFKSFVIIFENETRISAKRANNNGQLIGNYSLEYKSGIEQLQCNLRCEWSEVEHKYFIRYGSLEDKTRNSYDKILEKMKDMNVFYISDNRNEWDQEQDDINHRKYQQPKDPVEKEMNLLNDWIISQALEASKKGEEGTSEIYVKILSKLGKKKQEESSMTLEDISKEIELLDSRAKSYAQMGFIPDTDYSEVKTKLNKVLELNKEPAANILTPYLEIQKNRLDALDNLFKTITYFCDSLNEYLYKKRVYYSVSRGFLFYQMVDGENELPKLVKSKNEIDIKRLSSGERQLLRLFGMVIRNSQAAPIIIIDEPEISLNIKWQRRLLSTLSFFVRNNEAQFLIATHSFEILSSHIDNTVKLGDSYFPANHV